MAQCKRWLDELKSTVSEEETKLPSTATVRGYEWNNGIDYHKILESYLTTGFQATNFALAVKEIQKMIDCKKVPLRKNQLDLDEKDEFIRRKSNCTIFLGYTSNMVSCGIRETIRFLVEHKMVDCIVTTTGGVEEDFMKCLTPTYMGDFSLKGETLLHQRLHRIGNLLVPNINYVKLEQWLVPILDELFKEQKEKNLVWTPSKIITRLGEKINNPESIYYWAAKNKIPIFCPALTDGFLGDLMYYQSFKNPGFILDTISDVKRINSISAKALHSGMIILGGGVIKHHVCNANSMRDGANFAVYLNTASEFDGSDSGARPDEAVSWAKIRKDATPAKVHADATLIFPLLVAETFARDYHMNKSK